MSSGSETPTVAEVEAQYGPTDISKDPIDVDGESYGESYGTNYGGGPLEGDKSPAEILIDAAERMDRDIFGQQVLFTSRTRGRRKDRVTLLACHKWALREGEPQSESQSGGSVTYNTVTGEWQNQLTSTKWGREYLGYLEDQPNIGIFGTW